MQFIPVAALTLAAAVASWTDVLYRRVPNWLVGLTALGGLAMGFLDGGLAVLSSQALHMVIVLVAGMVLFRFGLFGGGDAKFYSAVAAWFVLPKAVLLLLSITSSGLVLLIAWFAYRRLRRLPIGKSSDGTHFDSLPYGIAIGAGAVFAILSPTFNLF
jgi:prepilin peptidase CpaA